MLDGLQLQTAKVGATATILVYAQVTANPDAQSYAIIENLIKQTLINKGWRVISVQLLGESGTTAGAWVYVTGSTSDNLSIVASFMAEQMRAAGVDFRNEKAQFANSSPDTVSTIDLSNFITSTPRLSSTQTGSPNLFKFTITMRFGSSSIAGSILSTPESKLEFVRDALKNTQLQLVNLVLLSSNTAFLGVSATPKFTITVSASANLTANQVQLELLTRLNDINKILPNTEVLQMNLDSMVGNAVRDEQQINLSSGAVTTSNDTGSGFSGFLKSFGNIIGFDPESAIIGGGLAAVILAIILLRGK